MEITYRNILEKIDSGEISLLEGVVKSKLAIEYNVDRLEPITVIGTMRARKRRIPLKTIKYTDKNNTIVLSELHMLMGVYLKVLGIEDGKLASKYVHLGDYPLENIARGLKDFKKKLSSSRDIAYSRLKTAERVEDIETCLKISYNLPNVINIKELRRTAEKEIAELPKVFNEINLYEELEKIAKEVFIN